jgi:hypothetical protein
MIRIPGTVEPLASSQGYGFADSPEHAEDSIALGGLPLLKHRCRSGEPHLHPMRQLVAGVLEKCVNDRELAASEVFPIAADVGEQGVGLLGEGRENPLLDLGVLGGVDDAMRMSTRIRRSSLAAFDLTKRPARARAPDRPTVRTIGPTPSNSRNRDVAVREVRHSRIMRVRRVPWMRVGVPSFCLAPRAG